MTEPHTELFRDLFRYYNKYENEPMDADDFVSAAEDFAIYVHKHGNTLLAKDLFGAIYEHLGNRNVEERRKQEDGEQTTIDQQADPMQADSQVV